MSTTICISDVPEPTFIDPPTDLAPHTVMKALHLGFEAPILIVDAALTGPGIEVIDPMVRQGHRVAVHRFSDPGDYPAALRAADTLAIVHLLDAAADGDDTTRAYTPLIDPRTGDASAQMAILHRWHPADPPRFVLVANTGDGDLRSFTDLDAAVASYTRALDTHAEACCDVEPYGRLAELTARQAAHRAHLACCNESLTDVYDELRARPDTPFTDAFLATTWGWSPLHHAGDGAPDHRDPGRPAELAPLMAARAQSWHSPARTIAAARMIDAAMHALDRSTRTYAASGIVHPSTLHHLFEALRSAFARMDPLTERTGAWLREHAEDGRIIMRYGGYPTATAAANDASYNLYLAGQMATELSDALARVTHRTADMTTA